MSSVWNCENIEKARPSQIIASLSEFRSKPAISWLDEEHPSVNGQVLNPEGNTIKKLSTARLYFSSAQLVTLIAACGPNHCLDGWSFLARAVSALVSRDGHAARHFAYYAQLRAALSILSSTGIGIFNGLNICVDDAGDIYKLEDCRENTAGKGTHSIIWPALQEWASVDVHAEYFLQSMRIHNYSFLELIHCIWPSRQTSSVVSPIIRNWAMDLDLGFRHHIQRNISSYNPHQFTHMDHSFSDDMIFMIEMWKLFEPSSSSRFDHMDVYFLRQIMQELYEADKSAHESSGSPNSLRNPIDERYEEIPSDLSSVFSRNFLLRDRLKDEPVLFSQAKSDGISPISMISRAALLLRAATGLTTASFHSAGFSSDGAEIRPWLDPILGNKGLAPISNIPVQMSDLWDELSFAIDDLRGALEAKHHDPHGVYTYPENGLPIVTQFERAAMWGLCP